MKLLAFIQEIGGITKSQKDKQADIDVSEVFHLWDLLTARYDVIEITNVLLNFAKDSDLKLVIKTGINHLNKQVKTLEGLMQEYAIPLPKRPPASADNTTNVEIITDEFIFRRIFVGIQSSIPVHATAFIRSTSPMLREQFKTFLIQEINIYDNFFEYGKLKGYTADTPNWQ